MSKSGSANRSAKLAIVLLACVAPFLLSGYAQEVTRPSHMVKRLAGRHTPRDQERAEAIAAFATVQKVLQHPRCLNCHIPGDQPLQFDDGTPHAMGIVRGPEGHGAPGFPCSSCHGERSPPAAYGPHAPPGAHDWALPPPSQKMAWVGLSSKQLCETLKDRTKNGNRDLNAMLEHISKADLVLWGWNPGGQRTWVSIPHSEFVAQFKRWVDAGAPCPEN